MKTIVLTIATVFMAGLIAFSMNDKTEPSNQGPNIDSENVAAAQIHEIYLPSDLMQNASEVRKQMGYIRN